MTDDQLNIERADVDGAATLLVRGEVDMASAPTLRSAIRALEDHDGALHLDMSGVTFIDSSGLNVLIAATALRKRRDGTLVVRNASPSVRRLLQLTGMDQAITLVDV